MFQYFVDLTCRAYNIVRRNAMLFINLFTMMISVGLPELTSRENVKYIRDMLVLDKDDQVRCWRCFRIILFIPLSVHRRRRYT